MKIVFMGTPEFAVPGLLALINEGHLVCGVVTSPDKPAGRGLVIQQSPVKKAALEYDIPVLQPTNLKSPDFIEQLKQLEAELFVIVAFRMLPESVWTMPPKGSINLHASLLPQYRGAAPINWAVINGETETGLTTFFLKHEIDTGNIIFSERVHVPFEMSAGELHDILKYKGAFLIAKTVNAIEKGDIKTTPQASVENIEKKAAPKLFPANCRIDWNKNAVQVYNLIRGLSPYPTATTELVLNEKETATLKIYKTGTSFFEKSGQAGSFQIRNKTELYINCADKSIQILEIQMAGKKRMATSDFLRGIKYSDKAVFI